jgi:hypothetical protein
MSQHPHPDPGEEELEALGTPVYEGSGLSVRALTAEELQRFLDAHADQPPSAWAAAGVPSIHRGAPSGFPDLTGGWV